MVEAGKVAGVVMAPPDTPGATAATVATVSEMVVGGAMAAGVVPERMEVAVEMVVTPQQDMVEMAVVGVTPGAEAGVAMAGGVEPEQRVQGAAGKAEGGVEYAAQIRVVSGFLGWISDLSWHPGHWRQ